MDCIAAARGTTTLDYKQSLFFLLTLPSHGKDIMNAGCFQFNLMTCAASVLQSTCSNWLDSSR